MADTAATNETPPAEQQAAQPTTPPPADQTTPPSLKDQVAALGFEGLKDDSDATSRLLEAFKQERERNNQFDARFQELTEQLQQRQPETTTQQATSSPWWKAPQINRQEVAHYRTADGWKEGTPDAIKQQYQAWENHRETIANRLFDDAEATIAELADARIQKRIEEYFGQTQQQQQLTQFEERIFTENPWLFEPNAITGKPNRGALSAEGKLIDQYMREAQAGGASYEIAWELAALKHAAAKNAAQSKSAEAAKTAQEQNDAQKKALVNRASGTANRAGSMPTATDTRTTQRNKHISFGRMTQQAASRNGVAVQ